uniref:Uncharacterized protein LOC104245480 n=1 Tax=Nicotiana sylvestris TaxID=4096 RepID=A0A1U7YBR9_NICSY|nr:PREDICTED: uncharacterized protein LOC104245480 [Nicotiana sylvestris]
MNGEDPEEVEEKQQEVENGSRKQKSTSVSSSGENDSLQENVIEIPLEYNNIVFCKLLCETDVRESCSVSIEKKNAEDHFPCLAPGESKMLEFADCRGNNVAMEFVRTNFGDYYLRSGWERYRDEHKLEHGDVLTVYKIEKQNEYFYIIDCNKLTPEDVQDNVQLVITKLIATLQDPNASIVEEPVVAKNLRYKDLYENSNGIKLELPKKEVEENLHDLPLPQVGGQVILPLFDPIGKEVIQMELVHTKQDEYYFGGRGREWGEYAAKHGLLIFDTVFVNKVTVNRDELSPSAECIWKKIIDQAGKLDDQVVNNSYYYQISYQLRSVKSNKKPKHELGQTENTTSAPSSTTTTNAGNSNNRKGKGVAIPQSEPEYDSDDAYWLSYRD